MEQIPFRWDIVGSFLRPEKLKKAREQFKQGEITQEALTEVEDEAIIKLIKKEKELGLNAVTDGEFRRRWWHLDFIAGLNGITVYDFETTAFGVNSKAQGTFVSGKLSFNQRHPFLDHFRFTKKYADAEDVVAKQTIPGPNMIFLDSFILSKRYHENPVYASKDHFIQDLIITYQEAIQSFYDAGCRYLQLDDERSGGFEPLQNIKDQRIVLGLITTKSSELEDKAALKERIKKANQYVPFEQLCLGTQCGFSSTQEGNDLKEEDQWKKIHLLVDTAKDIWQEQSV